MESIEKIHSQSDHISGISDARFRLIEYGSYSCSHCREAQQIISRVQAKLGTSLVYVFRHKPLRSDPWSIPSAVLAEYAAEKTKFWEVHNALMRHPISSKDDLLKLAGQFGFDEEEVEEALGREDLIARVNENEDALLDAGIRTTPSFIINGHKYDGAWDEMSLIEALNAPVAQRLERVAQDFAGWAPATGFLLAICTVMALGLANSPAEEWLHDLLETDYGIQIGGWSYAMPLHAVINDCLMSIFFLVVGLEIKRELTIGELSDLKVASLPIAAALGGMLVPASIYLLLTWGSPVTSGWGIPMATDIAFALGLLAILGRRVPIALKVFLTALAIVDDLGAIVVIAVFYGHGFNFDYALFSIFVFVTLLGINFAGVYNAVPYIVLGITLWVGVYASGLHATLAGILLAIAIPTRPPPNLNGLLAQARAIIAPQDASISYESNKFPERTILRSLDAVHDRIESPAHRIERTLEPWSSFFILPVFALANAGVPLAGFEATSSVTLAIVAGLVLGKPLGIGLACWFVTRGGFASLPLGVSWPMIIGVGFLAGVGFTMSIFISNEAFTDPILVENSKVAVLAASLLAATVGFYTLNRTLPDVTGKTIVESEKTCDLVD